MGELYPTPNHYDTNGLVQIPLVFKVGEVPVATPGTDTVEIARWGPQIERHPLFPERANVEVCTVLARGRIRMRVWERGVGVTQACGSGACASLVAAARRGLAERKAELILDGGSLDIEWREADGHVLMTGPVAISFSGTLDPSLLG